MSRRHTDLRAIGRRVDLDLAVRCIELSRLAYRPPALGADIAKRVGYQHYAWLSRREQRDFSLVLTDGQYRYVVFRGTDQHLDWLTNLRLWRRTTPYGRVHRGYYDVALAFQKELTQQLAQLPDLPTVFTGHSMGGALALLAALYQQEQGINVRSIYTFGQPQVGNKQFSAHVEEHIRAPYFRFVHGADAIAVWGMGQQALLGSVCYFDLRGRLQFGRHLGGLPKLSLRLHRLEHYRFYLRLNRLKLRALEQGQDATMIPP
ncbi:MAG: thioesterase domain-containing protein [Pseudomonadota bacterium]